MINKIFVYYYFNKTDLFFTYKFGAPRSDKIASKTLNRISCLLSVLNLLISGTSYQFRVNQAISIDKINKVESSSSKVSGTITSLFCEIK